MICVERVATPVYSSFQLVGVVRITSIALSRSVKHSGLVTLRVAGIILLSNPESSRVNIYLLKRIIIDII